MKCVSVLVAMFLTIVSAQLSYGQTQPSAQTPQTTTNKTASTGSKQHKKQASLTKTGTSSTTEANKPGGKGATLPSQDAAYALSGHKSAPEGAPTPKK